MHPTDPPPGPPPSPGTEPGSFPPLPKYGEVPVPRSGPGLPYYGQPPHGYPGHQAPPNQKTSTAAILALVFGAIGGIPVAIVLGIVALTRIPKTLEKGRGLAIGGIAAACAWIVVLALIGSGAGSAPERDASGQATTTNAVALSSLRVGDCVAGVDEGTTIRNLEVKPCSGPNGGRVYALFPLPAGRYPGLDAVVTAAQDECSTRWVEQGGKGTDPVDIVTLYPTEASWTRGERGVTCLLTPR